MYEGLKTTGQNMSDKKDRQQDNDRDNIVEPGNPLPPLSFDKLPLPLVDACKRVGWTSLMPVQSKSIPYLLSGRDLMVQSRTGSGKTAAYLLPILSDIDTESRNCQALVLVPTRELALQVSREASLLTGGTKLRTVPVYGGSAYGPQIEGFKKGAHLVVGTPGRILDHLIKGTLSLKGLKMLIFDEADRMLSMGFYPDMQKIHGFLPRRRVICSMFSATFPSHVMKLAQRFMNQPGFLSLSRDHVHVADTEHVFYIVPPMKKDRSLVKIIEIENPVSAIIFCNTKSNVHYVSEVLKRFGYDADELSADLSQGAREKVMGRIKRGELRFLVATDVAARGIDIPDLTHVIQYEPGEDPESYIHRAGRTGRAGAAGIAITLTAGMEEIRLKENVKQYKLDLIEKQLPEDSEVADLVAQRVTAGLESDLRSRDSLKTERMDRFIPLAESLGSNEDLVPLVAMLLDDYYQKSLNAALVTEEESSSARFTGKNRAEAGRSQKPGQRRRPGRKPYRGKRRP